MTTYAIGDVSGNYDLLLKLLEKIQFNAQQDRLWFTGNLINNEQPEPLAVIRFIKELGKAAISVLGNKDLELLASIEGYTQPDTSIALEPLAQASDFQDLIKWLRQRPLLHYDAKLNTAMIHAGIPPEWSLSQARTFAIEVESALSFGNHKTLFEYISGKPAPRRWNAKLQGWKRLHFIATAFTRMQQCTEKGYMDFGTRVVTPNMTDDYRPWYQIANRHMADINIIFNAQSRNDALSPANVFPLQSAENNAESLVAFKLTPTPESITVYSR